MTSDKGRAGFMEDPDGRPAPEEPKWRRDLPIDVEQDNYVARRDFVKFLVLISGAFVIGQIWILARGLWRGVRRTLPQLEIAGVETLAVGDALSFAYPTERDHCVLVRMSKDRFVAFDQVCTHLSCAVLPEFSRGRLYCPCHNGSFDLSTGRPLAGPPRRPLKRIRLELRDGAIYATGVEKSS